MGKTIRKIVVRPVGPWVAEDEESGEVLCYGTRDGDCMPAARKLAEALQADGQDAVVEPRDKAGRPTGLRAFYAEVPGEEEEPPEVPGDARGDEEE